MHESFLPVEGLTADQILTIQQQLYLLLARQTQKYTSGESSSIPEELAAELLDSICYCLEQHEAGLHVLLHQDGMEALTEGIRRVGRKQIRSSIAWQQVCNHLPPVENQSMLDTLGGIGTFLKQYNPRFFAHQIPGDIDYQLSAPVSEQLKGVDYINEYLKHLAIENSFLRQFTREALEPVLNASCPDYRGLLINLYEPVAANALGCSMLDRDIHALVIPPDGYAVLYGYFAGRTTEKIEQILNRAAQKLIEQLDMQSDSAKQYFYAYTQRLVPRIAVVHSSDGLRGIFPSADHTN